MPTKKWKVVVAKLGAAEPIHQDEVGANNWMAALKATLEALAEPPGMPPGASCTIDAHGVATVFDPRTRRKFLLTPLQDSTAARPEPRVRAAAATAAEPGAPRTPEPALGGESGKPVAKPRINTRDFAEPQKHAAAPAPIPVGIPPTAPRRGEPMPRAARAPSIELGRGEGLPALELLHQRNDDPSAESPLVYRERAYLMPRGSTAAQAEAALRMQLLELQRVLDGRVNRFVALAAFDHRWQDLPERPPTVVLQWRDWRDEIHVEYPAAVRFSSAPPPIGSAVDDRLPDVFAAAEALAVLKTPTEALDFVLGLLEETIPAEATSVCVYEASSDELRFAAVAGPFAASMQGYGVPRAGGLFGKALSSEHQVSVFADVLVEPAFNPLIDSRPGLDPRNMLLRPVVHERQLLGMLQLINRKGAGAFTAQDVHVVNYVAERLADFLSK